MAPFQDAIFTKTLICFLEALEGSMSTIDLRNESTVTGRIASVDSFMNLQIEDGTVSSAHGVQSHFSCLFIKGRQIRYVQIPETVDVTRVLHSQMSRYRRVKRGNPTSSRKKE